MRNFIHWLLSPYVRGFQTLLRLLPVRPVRSTPPTAISAWRIEQFDLPPVFADMSEILDAHVRQIASALRVDMERRARISAPVDNGRETHDT